MYFCTYLLCADYPTCEITLDMLLLLFVSVVCGSIIPSLILLLKKKLSFKFLLLSLVICSSEGTFQSLNIAYGSMFA